MDKGQPPAFVLFLIAAIALYGLCGSPTPDNPGIVEGVIGLLLLLALLTAVTGSSVRLSLGRNGFFKTLQILFLCGLILPTLSGVYFGNDRGLMLRDLLAFGFLILPLLLAEKFDGRERAGLYLTLAIAGAGFAFALRTLLPVFKLWRAPEELLYLSNSPLTMFAAIFIAGFIWRNLLELKARSIAAIAGGALLLSVILAAMLLDVQRATVGAVLISLAILVACDICLRPRKAVLPALLLCLGLALIYPLLDEALAAMATKTAEVGLNSRMAEAQAVIIALARDPVTLFVGHGWGSTFASPAVGGLDVNYTHSFLTTLLLKGGLVLFILGSAFSLCALYQIFLIFQRDRGIGLALGWSVFIPIFLYASHKSLDFALILLLTGMWSIRLQSLPKRASSDKTDVTA